MFSRVDVVDLSLGGLGILIEPPIDSYELGAPLELRIGTPEAEPVRVKAAVRHRARGVCGVEFQNLDDAALAALRRVIADKVQSWWPDGSMNTWRQGLESRLAAAGRRR